MQRTIELWQSCGKRPIRIEKDVNGYVANRLQAALVREATNLVAEGVASAEDIDTAVQTSFGLRFMVSGRWSSVTSAAWTCTSPWHKACGRTSASPTAPSRPSSRWSSGATWD